MDNLNQSRARSDLTPHEQKEQATEDSRFLYDDQLGIRDANTPSGNEADDEMFVGGQFSAFTQLEDSTSLLNMLAEAVVGQEQYPSLAEQFSTVTAQSISASQFRFIPSYLSDGYLRSAEVQHLMGTLELYENQPMSFIL
ncbi:hypothetical protein PCE1_000042 [Barthelona sp. PCE]